MNRTIGLLIITSLLFLGNAQSQKLVDEFGTSSTFNACTYYLFSDSSFYIFTEIGCKGRAELTTGTYQIKSDILVLFPTRQTDLNLIDHVEFINTDTSLLFNSKVKSFEDSIIECYSIYPSIADADIWKYSNLATDSLRNDESILLHPFTFVRYRTPNKTIAVCPLAIERLTGKRLSYTLEPKMNEVIIKLKLPYVILQYIGRYEIYYKDLEPEITDRYNRIIKIEYPE